MKTEINAYRNFLCDRFEQLFVCYLVYQMRKSQCQYAKNDSEDQTESQTTTYPKEASKFVL